MWVLFLNDMRASNVENIQPEFRAETKEALEEFLKREEVDPYTTDNRWHKVYRQGGPLEWFNPPYDLPEFFRYAGTAQDWATDAVERYNNQILSLREVR